MFAIVRRVAPVLVTVLLTWTAADVLNPGLCGLDQLPFAAAHASVDADGVPRDQPPLALDDCFCCSPNVNFSEVMQIPIAIESLTQAPADRIQNPRWKSFPLYHPPRLG